MHTLFLIIDTNYQSHHASFFKLTKKISYATLPKHANTYIKSCIKTKNYSKSYMLMHIYSNSTPKTKQKFKIFPSPTLKLNICPQCSKNKEIKGLKTSVSSKAKILLIFENVSLT